MANLPEKPVASGAIHAWLQQGEQLYESAMADYRALAAQLEDLEQKLAAKQAEVNQIASVIDKPPVESPRRSSDITSGQILEDTLPARISPPSSANANIARALTGKFGR